MFLLDTNVCICLINQRSGYERILKRMDGLEHGEVLISSISTAELHFGVAASMQVDRNMLKLERFLAAFEVVPFDEDASRRYGLVRAFLKARGTPIGPLDTLIAGHALALNATVVTNNVDEFVRVPGLCVEDWLADSGTS
jgi:tRNA(fMet)-specific endonuclease VapC